MSLGYAVTNQFLLGSFEVRVADFSQAGTLSSAHSVGVVDGVSLNFELTQVDVLNGTSSLIDRNIVRQLATIQFTFREFSERNWRMALGQSMSKDVIVWKGDTDWASDNYVVFNTSIEGVKPGYMVKSPTGNTYTIESVSSYMSTKQALLLSPTPTESLKSGTLLTIFYTDTTITSTPAGKTPYQTLQLVQQDRTAGGSYLVWDFWKVTVDGGFESTINHNDFASASLRFRTYDVTTDDSVPDTVKQYPVFRYYKTTTI